MVKFRTYCDSLTAAQVQKAKIQAELAPMAEDDENEQDDENERRVENENGEENEHGKEGSEH